MQHPVRKLGRAQIQEAGLATTPIDLFQGVAGECSATPPSVHPEGADLLREGRPATAVLLLRVADVLAQAGRPACQSRARGLYRPPCGRPHQTGRGLVASELKTRPAVRRRVFLFFTAGLLDTENLTLR